MNERKYTVFFRPWLAPKSYQVEAETSEEAYEDAFDLLIDEVGAEGALEYECYALNLNQTKEET